MHVDIAFFFFIEIRNKTRLSSSVFKDVSWFINHCVDFLCDSFSLRTALGHLGSLINQPEINRSSYKAAQGDSSRQFHGGTERFPCISSPPKMAL